MKNLSNKNEGIKTYEDFNSLKQEYFRELETYINMYDYYITHYKDLTYNVTAKSNQDKFIIYLKNNINSVITKLLMLDSN